MCDRFIVKRSDVDYWVVPVFGSGNIAKPFQHKVLESKRAATSGKKLH